MAELRARGYDLIVHLSEQPRGAWLARWLGARYSVAPKMADRGKFWQRSFTHFYPLVARRHMVEVNLDALRRIGVQPALDERKVTFVPGAQAEQAVDKLLDGGPFIHLHPASRWRFKCWTAEKNAELIDRFAAEGHQVVVTAAPDETQMIDEILGQGAAPSRSTSPASSRSSSSARWRRARGSSSASTRCRCTSPRRWACRRWRCSGRAARASGGRGTSRTAW